MNIKKVKTHINNIRIGDTIEYKNTLRTVCKNDIKYNVFTGVSIFGDNFNGGTKPVIKILFKRFCKDKCFYSS